jgi:hypothetical protein
MTCAAPVQNDTIWLEFKNYAVVPLNSRLSSHVSELRNALGEGVPAYPDNSRDGFYDIELESGWSYVHIHDDARTVYLVAFSRN